MATANTAANAAIIARIKAIDEILESGVESVTTDGTTTRVNHDSLRKERRELRQQVVGGANRNPVLTPIKFGG